MATDTVPYSRLAQSYDFSLGLPIFRRTRRIFEWVVRRFGLRFRDAADIGCGTGLFCHHLASRWRTPIFGVDLSPAMLRVASSRCRGLPVRLACQDMSRLSLPHPVDLITCHFDAINHLTEPAAVRRTLHRVHRALRPGGHFLFDALTTCQRLAPGVVHTYQREKNGRRMTQHVCWSPSSHLLKTVVLLGSSASPSVTRERHHERLYPPGALLAWLRRAGFRVRALVDASTLRPTRRCSPRLVILARKE